MIQTGQLAGFTCGAKPQTATRSLGHLPLPHLEPAVEDIGLFEYYADGYGGCDALVRTARGVTGIFAPLTVPYARGYDQTTAFRIRFDRPGAHTITVTLDDLAADPPQTRATLTREVEVQVWYFLPLIGR